MPIFDLKDIAQDSHHWSASTYQGPVIVRAQDENEARQIATAAYFIAANRQPGKTLSANPWKQAGVVSCQPMAQHTYEEDGPSEILFPGDGPVISGQGRTGSAQAKD